MLTIFQLSGPPTPAPVIYKPLPDAGGDNHQKLVIGSIAGGATAILLLLVILLLRWNRFFKMRGGEGSVSSEGRRPIENEEPYLPSPTFDDKHNLVKNSQGMCVSYL